MARNARKTVNSEVEAIGRSGKLKHIQLLATGDRIFDLREVNVSGNVIYRVNTALGSQIHQDLDLSFRTALFAEVVSGTTGELQIIYE